MKRRLFLLPAILLLGFLSSCGKPEEFTFDDSPRPVVVQKLDSHSQSPERRLLGRVKAVTFADLSFEVTGPVSEVSVLMGDTVEKGDSLAVIDPKLFQIETERARAEIQQVQARVFETRKQATRLEELVKNGGVSQREADVAEAEYAIAQEQLNAAQQRLHTAEENLSDTTLRAPFRGVVSNRTVEPGQVVDPNEVVLRIQCQEHLEAEIEVPETLLSQFAIGDVHSLAFPSLGEERYTGKVREIATFERPGNAFPVIFEILDPSPKLRPGMTSKLFWREKKETEDSLFEVPMTAVVARSTDEKAVFLLDRENQQARLHTIQISAVNGRNVYVSSGLSFGDELITSGAAFLSDSQSVSPIGEGATVFLP